MNTEFYTQTTEYQLNQKLPDTEKKFPEHKLGTNSLALKLEKVGLKREFNLVCNCGTCLDFALKEHIKTKERKLKLAGANFCKFRFCLMCNWRRNKNITGQLNEALEAITATRKLKYLFLTLTIKNPNIEDLKATVKHLNQSFQRLHQTKRFKNSILGYFKGLELIGDNTFKRAGEAHPHFHVLLLVNPSYFKSRDYISKAEWTEMWRKALRIDYEPIVHIQKAYKNPNKDMTEEQSISFEVAKYAAEHSELVKMRDEDFYELIMQSQRMRFVSTGGILKDKINLLKADEDLIRTKEEENALWKELMRLYYSWVDGDYYLKDIKPPKTKEDENENTSR